MSDLKITRGSTPDIQIAVPTDACTFSEDLHDAWVTIRCSGMPSITKKLIEGDLEADASTNTVILHLTQKDTLPMRGSKGEIQLKLMTVQDLVFVSQIEEFDILPAVNDEEML